MSEQHGTDHFTYAFVSSENSCSKLVSSADALDILRALILQK